VGIKVARSLLFCVKDSWKLTASLPLTGNKHLCQSPTDSVHTKDIGTGHK